MSGSFSRAVARRGSISAPVSPRRAPLLPPVVPRRPAPAQQPAHPRNGPFLVSPTNAQNVFALQAYGSSASNLPAPSSPSLRKLDSVKVSCKTAKDFRIVQLTSDILYQHGSIPIGLLGTLLHRETQDHGLPSYFKEVYGGLKKFIAQFSPAFAISSDHRFNPSISLHALPMSDRFGGARVRAREVVELTRSQLRQMGRSPLSEPARRQSRQRPRVHRPNGGLHAMMLPPPAVRPASVGPLPLTPLQQQQRSASVGPLPPQLQQQRSQAVGPLPPTLHQQQPPLGDRARSWGAAAADGSGARTSVINARAHGVSSAPPASPKSIFQFSSPFSPRMMNGSSQAPSGGSTPLNTPSSLRKQLSVESVSSFGSISQDVMQLMSQDGQIMQPTSQDRQIMQHTSQIMHPTSRDAKMSSTSLKHGGCKCCVKMSYLEDVLGRRVMSPDSDYVSLHEFSSAGRGSNLPAGGWSPLQRLSGRLSEIDFSEFETPLRSMSDDDIWITRDMPALPGLAGNFVPSRI